MKSTQPKWEEDFDGRYFRTTTEKGYVYTAYPSAADIKAFIRSILAEVIGKDDDPGSKSMTFQGWFDSRNKLREEQRKRAGV